MCSICIDQGLLMRFFRFELNRSIHTDSVYNPYSFFEVQKFWWNGQWIDKHPPGFMKYICICVWKINEILTGLEKNIRVINYIFFIFV